MVFVLLYYCFIAVISLLIGMVDCNCSAGAQFETAVGGYEKYYDITSLLFDVDSTT